MGSKSSSKSATNDNQRQVSQNAAGNQGIAASAGGNVTINALDGGAIDSAFDFASEGLEDVLDWTSAQSKLAFSATEQALDHSKEAYENFVEHQRTETAQSLDKLTKYFFFTVALFGTVWGLNKFR